ncbi:(2Fe-2S)-binding protein [Streptomyces sp. 7N604]|uniref:(2Fe-2S)-binding protein n=1 Tax=Streptomyces sp. 7N604 TaxID=3457415 RepID=UPI003FD08B1F
MRTVTIDGEEHAFVPGRTIAAILIAAGRTSWRTTRHGGRPRGLFCGIGICHDCLVTVNGLPAVRACLREAEAGDDIRTGPNGEDPNGEESL